jgi:hypothetical protein
MCVCIYIYINTLLCISMYTWIFGIYAYLLICMCNMLNTIGMSKQNLYIYNGYVYILGKWRLMFKRCEFRSDPDKRYIDIDMMWYAYMIRYMKILIWIDIYIIYIDMDIESMRRLLLGWLGNRSWSRQKRAPESYLTHDVDVSWCFQVGQNND